MSNLEEFAQHLKEATRRFLRVDDSVAEPLWKHYELMVRWNRRLNLTRVVSLEEAVEKHYAESLFLASRIPNWVCSVLDVGSGAGFPGFPVAVARPGVQVTLLESDRRKAAFLREVSDIVGNVRVDVRRADSVEGEWDCLTCRAVGVMDLETIVEGAAKFVAVLAGEGGVAEIKGWKCLNRIGVQQLPWGERRFLVTGHVPRETSRGESGVGFT